MTPLKFSLAVEGQPVILVGPDGKEITYELREMCASARDKYLDQLGERMKVDTEGKVAGVKKFDGLQATLVSMCLYDAEGHLVKKEVVQGWPAGTVSSLFQEAQKLNALIKDEKEGAEADETKKE
jgi:activator of 2-hydroxyglutaryl-CoA dehydratase